MPVIVLPELLDPNGYVFLACFGCYRLDLIEYDGRILPAYIKEGDDGSEYIVVLTIYGIYRKKPAFSGQSKGSIKSKFLPTFRYFSPEWIKRSNPVRATYYIIGREVSMLSVDRGVAYKDANLILRDLEGEDRIISVNLGRFQEGYWDNLKLGYLRGGLIPSGL